jgi:hypothetical protein
VVSATAYQAWAADESFDDFQQLLQNCLCQARPAAAALHG